MSGLTSCEKDIEIVFGIMDRNEDALRTLIKRFGGIIRALARKEFGNIFQESEIEEVLTRTAMKAWNKVDTFDDTEGSLKGWLLTIAYREGINILRGYSRDVGLQNPELVIDNCDVKEEKLSKKKKKEVKDLNEIIANLPNLQQNIILADLKSQDVADATRLAAIHGTTKNSIYVSRNKAREKIRVEMINRGHFRN